MCVQDALHRTSCGALYQDFFELLSATEADARAVGDESATVLRSRVTGKCIGVALAGRVRMTPCGNGTVLFRNELRLDDSEYIGKRSTELGVSPLVSYGSADAVVSAWLHRRLIGGTVSVLVHTPESNVTLVDARGHLHRSPSGWVYMCRVTRTAAGDRYWLLRNGTVVDTQYRNIVSRPRPRSVPIRLALSEATTADVLLPSLVVVSLEGGASPSMDDADRRYASGWRWRMYRSGGDDSDVALVTVCFRYDPHAQLDLRRLRGCLQRGTGMPGGTLVRDDKVTPRVSIGQTFGTGNASFCCDAIATSSTSQRGTRTRSTCARATGTSSPRQTRACCTRPPWGQSRPPVRWRRTLP